jgi:hypothetical protein
VSLPRSGRLALVLAGGLSLVALGLFGLRARSIVVDVPPSIQVTDVINAVPVGSTVRLLPGEHEPFAVTRAVRIEAEPGATIRSPILVAADDVTLRDLVVVGGENGITIEGVDGVVVEGVTVRGASLHGIEISNASAAVRDCRIDMVGAYAQGIEVRNTTGRPRSSVKGCRVSGGLEGLLTHVSRAEFVDNEVWDTSLRGIAITEMSEGLVAGNRVHDIAGAGLYCGDMSHCEFRDNNVRDVIAAPGAGRSAGGFGAVAWYYAKVRLAENRFEELEAPHPVRVTLGSSRTPLFPLSIWPQGWWRGAAPGLLVSAIALGTLGLVRVALTPSLRARRRRLAGRGGRRVAPAAEAILLAGFVVQGFHMLEHVVQVIQVNVQDAEVRRGLAGAVFDTEWVHFGYNLSVLVFLVWAWRVIARLDPSDRGAATSYGFVLSALVIQSYHLVEHLAKILQHVTSGLDPAPGLIGDQFGLIWFHYGINLAVFTGFAASAVPLLGQAIRELVRPNARLSEANA